ncbi:glycosyl transferase family 2 [Marinobacterium zhoushanense]|uniref:Glycosyl transferase family 2 n=1 Tax=Marinobacterium zhoushanense TaxID=1679163 RepID=A0ABQ1KUI9_9GAMM|nr:glycosyltransferase family 2 protein [Marinobacterium zhoushanense]GGC06740.1 glycosyl transferase family 2 [Marinobacterium zhoushanense]
MSLAVIILTYNEEIHIQRSIASVKSIADQIFVIDSFSSDRTAELAEAAGAKVLQNNFINHAKQFQWGLDNAQIKADWVMRLDADEIIEPDLQEEINNKLPSLPSNVVGINLRRKHIFMGRWVRYGGRYPLVLLRIWRNGQGRIEDRWMDEHMVVWGGKTITLKGGFSDCNLNDITFFTNKHNKYATREAVDVLNQRYRLFIRDNSLSRESTSFQAAAKRWLKENVYNKLPFTISALLYFIWRYVFQLGFLDGRSGLIYHFLQGYWYRFLVGAKIMEIESAFSTVETNSERIKLLERITGLCLEETEK